MQLKHAIPSGDRLEIVVGAMSRRTLLQLLALALLATAVDALALSACARPAARTRHSPVRACDNPAAATGTVDTLAVEQAKASGEPQVYPNNINEENEFVKWYRAEKAIEEWKKENPTDVLKEAGNKIKRCARSLSRPHPCPTCAYHRAWPARRGAKRALALSPTTLMPRARARALAHAATCPWS